MLGVALTVVFRDRLLESSASRFAALKEGQATFSRSSKEGIEESEVSAIEGSAIGSVMVNDDSTRHRW